MNINSYILRISGKAELPRDITEGHNYHVSLEGSIPKVEFHDNEDSTWNKIFTFKPVKIELLDQKGETLKLKDTRTKSQLFRGRVWAVWNRNNNGLSQEEFYNRLMDNLIQQVEEVCSLYAPQE